MRVDVVVTMDDGRVLRGVTNLSAAASVAARESRKAEARAPGAGSEPLDFTLPPRAFMKRYARDLSGPIKLTLLIACVAGGKVGAVVTRAEAEKLWNKMEGLLGGGYNGAYDTRARDSGWISSPKAGVFQLREGWEGAIE
jgi:hypothetical protein